MGGLFGGGSSSTTTTTKPQLTEAQEGMLKTSGNIVQNFYNNLKGDDKELSADDYAKLVAGLTPDQQTAIGQIRGIATSGDYKAGLDKALGMTSGASGMPDVSKFYNPYQQDVIDATVNDLNTQTGRQQAALAAAQAGKKAFGSRADLATGQFLGDANRTLASTVANLRSTGYNTALGAAQNQQRQDLSAANQYAQQVGQLQGGLLNTANALQQSGTLQQQQQQAILDAPLTAAGRVSSISAGFPTGTQTTSTQPTASPFSQLLGAGLTAASFFKDGGMADGGPAADMQAWAGVSTPDIKALLDAMAPDDPNRDIVSAVYAARAGGLGGGRRASSLPSLGLGITNKPFGDASWGPGRTNPILPRPAQGAQVDEPRGIGPVEPLPQLPTNMAQFSPQEIAAGREATQMKARADAARSTPADSADSFLGGAPAFDILPAAAPGGEGGLSFSGKPNNASGFPALASAISDLIGASSGGAGIPNRPDAAVGLGAGRSLRPIQVSATPAMAPAPVQGIGAAQAVDTALPANSNAAPADGRGWLGRHLDGALDNPLLYIGLGLMASKDPSVLGAIGEGAASGIGAYSQRRQRQAQLAMEGSKQAQDLYFDQQKLAIQRAVAEGQMTEGQARLALAEASGRRADRAANKPSPTAEKMQYLQGLGASRDEQIRALGGADAGRMDERTKFLSDWMKQNPGAAIEDGIAVWDQLQATGAPDDDLMSAAGF